VDLGYQGHVQDGKARFMEALAINRQQHERGHE
jgi:hypothetical protein